MTEAAKVYTYHEVSNIQNNIAKHNIKKSACLLAATLLRTSCCSLVSAKTVKIRGSPGSIEAGSTMLPDGFNLPEDEPTINLDLQHQLEVLDLIRDVTVEREITTLIILHDLNLAARYAEKIVVMHNGAVYASRKPISVLTPEMVRYIYIVHSTVYTDGDGMPQITPISSARRKVRVGRLNKGSKFGW